MRTVISRPQLDTVRFTVPAAARRCTAGRGFLIEGREGGNGVLVWLHRGDSIPNDDYAIRGVRDTVTPQGAGVAVRYMTGDVAHGLSLDSGTATLRRAATPWSLEVNGSGLEIPGGLRIMIAAQFLDLAPATDTISCQPQP